MNNPNPNPNNTPKRNHQPYNSNYKKFPKNYNDQVPQFYNPNPMYMNPPQMGYPFVPQGYYVPNMQFNQAPQPQVPQQSPSIPPVALSQVSPAQSSPVQQNTTPTLNKVKITTKLGENVSFQNSSVSPVKVPIKLSTPISTPVANNITLVPTAPVSATSSPAKSNVKADAIINDFKKNFQEQMRKKQAEKALKEAGGKSVESKPKEEVKAETKEEPKVEIKEEPKVEPKVEVEAKVEDKVDPIEEIKAEEPKVEEKVETTPAVNVAESTEEPKAEELKEVSQTETPEAESAEKEGSDPSESTESADKPLEQIESSFTISRFFEKLSNAKNIEDPFEFQYPEGIVGPAKELKNSSTKKYRYNPSFLYSFGDVLRFPLDLEWKEKMEKLITFPSKNLTTDSYKTKNFNQGNKSNSSRNYDMGSRQGSRQGSKRKGTGQMQGGGRDGRDNRGDGRDRSSRKGNFSKRDSGRMGEDQAPAEPVEPVKPLTKSANGWVPRSRAKKAEVKLSPDGTEIFEASEIERKVNSLLNKLTLEMFEDITNEIIQLAMQSKYEEDAATIKQIISLTYAKACDEPHWSSMYAQFCGKLCRVFSNEVVDKTSFNKVGEPLAGGALVRKILLTTCQTEYERGWTDRLPTKADGSALEPEMMSEEYYIAAAAKRRGLGLVKFIGELFLLRLLSDNVIFRCLNDQSKNTTDPSEDTLENLVQLVISVGAMLEANPKASQLLTSIFARVQEIIDNVPIPSRIKFMLMDLQDLRRKNWVSENKDAGPKTLQEIHDEVEKKRMDDERASQDRRRRQPDSRNNSSRQGSNWGQNKLSQNDIKNVGVMRNSDRNQLTPVNNFNKSKSSRNSNNNSQTNTRENSRREASVPTPASVNSNVNIFAALLDEEEERHYPEETEAVEENVIDQEEAVQGEEISNESK